MDPTTLQRKVLDEFGLRIGPHTADYLGERIASGESNVPVMGVEGRTGVAVTAMLDASKLAPGSVMEAS